MTGDKPIIPHVLVYSASQQNLHSATKTIISPAQTEFKATPQAWLDLISPFTTMSSANSYVHTEFFLILDEQSMEDRKVVMVNKNCLFYTPDGMKWAPGNRDDLVKVTLWKRYRVPFDKVFEFSMELDRGGLDEDADAECPYFEETVEGEREACS
jgi:hypothetical protein